MWLQIDRFNGSWRRGNGQVEEVVQRRVGELRGGDILNAGEYDVEAAGKTTCGLCSRLRRGNLYSFAQEIGATKIALGHHRDDIMETLFLNMFYGGKLKAMPPKLLSDDKKNIVIRPLAYCKAKDLQSFAAQKQFPIIPCNLCGSQQNLQRQVIKEKAKASVTKTFTFLSSPMVSIVREKTATDTAVKKALAACMRRKRPPPYPRTRDSQANP